MYIETEDLIAKNVRGILTKNTKNHWSHRISP